MTNYEKVLEFHKKFDIRVGATGFLLPHDRAMLRTRLMMEELAETVEAMQLNDYVKVAKELGDLLYTIYGTAAEYGIPMDEVFAEVHRSNMTKEDSLDPGGKVRKGEYFEEADIASVLTGVK